MNTKGYRERLKEQKMQAKKMYGLACQLLLERKSLFLYPLLICLMLFALVLGLFYLAHLSLNYFYPQLIFNLHHRESYTVLEDMVVILSLLAIYFIGIFLLMAINASVIIVTTEFINNRKASLGQILNTLYLCKVKIAQWSLFFGSFGLIINFLEMISDTITALLISFIGYSFYSLSWAIMPIIIQQNLGPIEAIKQARSVFISAMGGEVIFLRTSYLDWRLWLIQLLFMGACLLTFNAHFPEQYKAICLSIFLTGFFIFLFIQCILITILRAMSYDYATNNKAIS